MHNAPFWLLLLKFRGLVASSGRTWWYLVAIVLIITSHPMHSIELHEARQGRRSVPSGYDFLNDPGK